MMLAFYRTLRRLCATELHLLIKLMACDCSIRAVAFLVPRTGILIEQRIKVRSLEILIQLLFLALFDIKYKSLGEIK